jgi:enoyl-CoA hydratase/3-hydroxyacyl-CoA dehydrogenase
VDIKNVAVIGAGEMGHGIAELFAINGFNVNLMDAYEDALKKGLARIRESLNKLAEKGKVGNVDDIMSRIKTFTDIQSAVKNVDLVVEAVPELLDLKIKVFKDVDAAAPRHAILASNTSNIRISDLAAATSRPEMVVGMHFFNPPVVMKLVEVIRGSKTNDEAFQAIFDLSKTLGKTPVKVLKDSPGFIVNRIQAPELLLLCLIQDKGVATPEEVDALLLGQGLPMGAYELLDFVGIDVVYHSMEYFSKALSGDYGKCVTIKKMYEEKRLGKKTGKGFYDWSKGRPSIDIMKVTNKVGLLDFFAVEINEAVKVLEEGVAEKPEDVDTAVMLGLNRPFGPFSVAKSLSNEEVKAKLESLANEFGVDVFKPTRSIVEGKLREVAQGRIKFIMEQPQQSITREARQEQATKPGVGVGQFETIKVEKFDFKVARISLNRPKYNTINGKVLDELNAAIDALWDDPEINVVIITGVGDIMSAGADLTGFYFSNPLQFTEFSRKGERTFRRLMEMPKLTIAAIKGYALGGGLELSLACDLRVATEDSQIGFPEVTLGLIPGWGGTQRAVKLIGISRANQLVLTGERISAKIAHEWGLINVLFPRDGFDDRVLQYAKDIAAKVAPISVALAKRLTNKAGEVASDVGLEMEATAMGLLFSTEDLKEGIMAFSQKRQPNFKGR